MTCDDYLSTTNGSMFTCASLESNFGADCSGCTCDDACPVQYDGMNCDEYVAANAGYGLTCAYLESSFGANLSPTL